MAGISEALKNMRALTADNQIWWCTEKATPGVLACQFMFHVKNDD